MKEIRICKIIRKIENFKGLGYIFLSFLRAEKTVKWDLYSEDVALK